MNFALQQRNRAAGPLQFVVAGLLSLALAVALAIDVRTILVVAAAIAAVGIVASPRFRIVFLIAGGLVAFQSSDSVSAMKSAYVAGAVVCIAFSVYAALLDERAMSDRRVRFMIWTSLALVAMVLMSGVLAAASRTDPLSWARDSLPYLLLASAPFIAVDASRIFTIDQLKTGLALAGFLCAISFATTWLGRREFSALSLDTFFLPSPGVAAAAMSMSVSLVASRSTQRSARIGWFALACVIPACMLVTGTRTAAALLMIPVAVAFASTDLTAFERVGGLLLGLFVSGVAVLILVIAIASLTDTQTSRVTERLSAVTNASRDRGLANSVAERESQTREARLVWSRHPLLGVSPGYEFRWTHFNGEIEQSFTLDSTLTFAAKFGWLGIAFLLVWIWGLLGMVYRGRLSRVRWPRAALTGFFAYFVVVAIPSAPLEDKGISFALMLLLGMQIRSGLLAADGQEARSAEHA